MSEIKLKIIEGLNKEKLILTERLTYIKNCNIRSSVKGRLSEIDKLLDQY